MSALAQTAASPVRLPDGSVVTVRRIHRSDSDLLLEHFDRLGVDSRYRRFFGPVDHLTPGQVEYFTHPDHSRHEALFALDERGHPVGVARYIGSPDDPTTAEIAAAVVDDWQGRGVGNELLRRLARAACAQGIRRFTAWIMVDNNRMRRLLGKLGPVEALSRNPGGLELSVRLDAHGDAGRDRA